MDKCAILVCFEQLVPCATPYDLGDVPASAAEEGLQLLDNLGVTTHRAVKTLQVTVDDKSQVVQLIERCLVDSAARFWLIHLTVAQECPYVLVGGVLDAAHLQVLVKACLVDSVDWAQAHGNGWELPEPIHAVWVRVGRQAIAWTAGDLLAEAVEVVFI